MTFRARYCPADCQSTSKRCVILCIVYWRSVDVVTWTDNKCLKSTSFTSFSLQVSVILYLFFPFKLSAWYFVLINFQIPMAFFTDKSNCTHWILNYLFSNKPRKHTFGTRVCYVFRGRILAVGDGTNTI